MFKILFSLAVIVGLASTFYLLEERDQWKSRYADESKLTSELRDEIIVRDMMEDLYDKDRKFVLCYENRTSKLETVADELKTSFGVRSFAFELAVKNCHKEAYAN